MKQFLERVKTTRRGFLKTSAAMACLEISGCSNILHKLTDKPAHVQDERWVSAACWHNCGSRCLNKVLVADGVVVRQKTDDIYPDTKEMPQIRGCLKGRSQRKQVFAEDRLKYPMVRKNWKPGGGGDKSLRGRDEWVRISWDEVLDIIASELKRVKSKYGNRSIMINDSLDNEYKRTLAAFGGFVDVWTSSSYGSWLMTPTLCGYAPVAGMDTANDRTDYENCDTIILVGSNVAWTSFGQAGNTLMQAKLSGTEFIGIDPVFNETYAMLDAEWIPIRPATDIAFMLGIAHTLLVEDDPDKNPLIDWEFLKKNTIGFDAAGMPEGTNKRDNFRDYVLGTYDNCPKDAHWASEICGAGEEQIRKIARKMGVKNKTAFLMSWGVGRNNNVDNLPQLCMTLGAMTGQTGKSGHMTGTCCHIHAANHGPALVKHGSTKLAPLTNPITDVVNEPDHADALCGKPFRDTGAPMLYKWKPCEMRQADIRFMLYGKRSRMQTQLGILKSIDVMRHNVDCIVAPVQFLTNNAYYADIVLPVTTQWEVPGGFLSSSRDILLVYSKVIEPLYEARSDRWIAEEIAKRLGYNDLFPLSDEQMFFNGLAGSTVITADGSGYEPLCTITEEDIERWGVSGTPQKGRIALDELIEHGIYKVPRTQGDPYGFIAFEKFREDPEKYPVKYSESGKFEIYCKELARRVTLMGYSSIEPIPTYIPPLNGYEHTFSDWKNKIKGEYPYQMVTMHYMKRVHSTMDNVKQLGEAFHNPVLISSADAGREDIRTGNTVLISSSVGKTLRTALVTERVMPGCVVMYHGSWTDIDENTGIDYGGSDNILCPAVSTGQGVAGYNSNIVNIKKFSDKPLRPDADKPLRLVGM